MSLNSLLLLEELCICDVGVKYKPDNTGKLHLISWLSRVNVCPRAMRICPRCPETACYRSLGSLQRTRFTLNMLGAEANVELSNLEVSTGRSRK